MWQLKSKFIFRNNMMLVSRCVSLLVSVSPAPGIQSTLLGRRQVNREVLFDRVPLMLQCWVRIRPLPWCTTIIELRCVPTPALWVRANVLSIEIGW